MSKAAELAKAGETLTNQPSGRKNIVTNGAMQVAQRSASVADIGAASGYFTCDRWETAFVTSGRLTMAQVADGPSGFANCIKLDCTTADTSIAATETFQLRQKIEGQDLQQLKKGTSDAESVTVSFYVKGNAAVTYVCELLDTDNARNNTQSFDVTTDWTKVTLTYIGDTSGVLNDDNANSLQIAIWLHAGSDLSGGTFVSNTWAGTVQANRAAGIDSFFSSTDNEFFITGVQMEIGSQATNFEHRSYGEEFDLCLRYFQKVGGEADDGNVSVGSGLWYTTTIVLGHLQFQKRMRASPTSPNTETDVFKIYYSTANIDSNDATPVDVLQPASARIVPTMTSGGTAGHGAHVLCNGTNFVTFDAEL